MVKRLTLSDVGVAYGKRRILSGITTPEMKGGEVIAVIGPNAAGKSSLFRRIAGLIPGAGSVQVDSTAGKAPCYLPQDTAVNAVLTVYESGPARPQAGRLLGRGRRRTRRDRRGPACARHRRPCLPRPWRALRRPAPAGLHRPDIGAPARDHAARRADQRARFAPPVQC